MRHEPPQRAAVDAVALAGWRYEVNQIGVNFNQALKLAHTWGASGELLDGARGLWDALESARVQLARLQVVGARSPRCARAIDVCGRLVA